MGIPSGIPSWAYILYESPNLEPFFQASSKKVAHAITMITIHQAICPPPRPRGGTFISPKMQPCTMTPRTPEMRTAPWSKSHFHHEKDGKYGSNKLQQRHRVYTFRVYTWGTKETWTWKMDENGMISTLYIYIHTVYIYTHCIYTLVGGLNPSEKYESVGIIFCNTWKNKIHVPNHPPWYPLPAASPSHWPGSSQRYPPPKPRTRPAPHRLQAVPAVRMIGSPRQLVVDLAYPNLKNDALWVRQLGW